MRAREIFESQNRNPNQLEKVCDYADVYSWYHVKDIHDIRNWEFPKWMNAKAPVPEEFITPDHKAYVALRPEDLSYTLSIVISHGSEVVLAEGGRHYGLDRPFENLFAAVGLTHSKVDKRLWNMRKFVQNGHMLSTRQLLLTNKIAETADGSPVFEVAAQYRPLVAIWNFDKNWPTADKILIVEVQPDDRTLFYAIKKGKITGKGPMVSHDKDLVIKYEKQLSNIPQLNLTAGATLTIKPNSALHKMLRYVADNPGMNRTTVYKKGLGRSSTMGFGSVNSISSLDGLAAKAGLMDLYSDPQYPEAYSYTITTPGTMVLAALDNGTPVPIGDLLD